MRLWNGAHPLVDQWFFSRFSRPTEVQTRSWEAIASGNDVLLSAPTGSGKTLAAFLWFIDRWFRDRWSQDLVPGSPAGPPNGRTPATDAARPAFGRVLYLSPLKALNADMYRNLLEPLSEIAALAPDGPPELPRVALRSGDSTQTERERILRYPPDIFVTTPESIHLMLTSRRGRQALTGFSALILDEIHALAESKRGSMNALNVERLEALNPGVQRIGISATVNPIELAASFLTGVPPGAGGSAAVTPGRYGQSSVARSRSNPARSGAGAGRSPRIVQTPGGRRYEFAVELGPPGAVSWWDRQVPLIADAVETNRTTLIFCNSRRTAEKAARKVNEHLGYQAVFAHHGSLSREYRYWVESELKAGRLKAVAATGTLELGIDIGSVDEVLLLQAPFSASSAVQRAGRAGHRVGGTSRTRFVPLHPRDIVYALALVGLIGEGSTEPLRIPEKPLDVLAQVVVSEAAGRRIDTADFFAMVTRAWPYRGLSAAEFRGILELLAGRYEHTRVSELRARIVLGPPGEDGLPAWFEGREELALLVYQSGGTIPDRGYYDLRVAGSGDKIGELDEEFVFERQVGDRFSLGNRSWRIDSIDNQKVTVSPHGEGGLMIPFWKADAVGTGSFLADRVRAVLRALDEDPAAGWTGVLNEEARRALESYVLEHRGRTGTALPHDSHIVCEELRDPVITPDMHHLIVHTFWGGRVNAPLCFCLRELFRREFGARTPGLYTDDAVVISYPKEYAGWDPFAALRPHEIAGLLNAILPGSGIFGVRFRENCGRALLVLRSGFGKRTPLWIHRMKSKQLFERVLGEPGFPIIAETWRSLENDDFDLPALASRLEEIAGGSAAVSRIVTEKPSPFAADLMWLLNNEYLYADDSLPALPPEGLGGFTIADSLPDIPAAVIESYLAKRRRLHTDYLPEDGTEWLLYFQERRALSRGEIEELETAAPGVRTVLEVCGRYRSFAEPAGAGARPGEAGKTGSMGALDMNGAPGAAALWFHESIPDQVLDDSGRRGEIFLEHSRWQAWIPEDAAAAWNLPAVPEELLYADGRLIHPEVLDALLRFRRRLSREALPEVTVAELRWLAARQTGLLPAGGADRPERQTDSRRLFGTSSETRALLERFAGFRANALTLFAGVLGTRLPGVSIQEIDGVFRSCGMVWQGAGGADIRWFPEDEAAIFADPGGEVPDTLEPLFRSPGARFTFQSLAAAAALSTTDLMRELWNAAETGTLVNDSLEALYTALEQKWFPPKKTGTAREAETGPGNEKNGTPEPATAREAIPAAMRKGRPGGRRSRAEWNMRFASPGCWMTLPGSSAKDAAGSGSGVSAGPGPAHGTAAGTTAGTGAARPKEDEPGPDPMEALTIRVYQLFERYPILNRSIVAAEGSPYSWSELLPVLRRLELAGELSGGQFCPEAGGLQFVRQETLDAMQAAVSSGSGAASRSAAQPAQRPVPGGSVSAGTRAGWCWFHTHDPAALLVFEPGIARKQGANWMLGRIEYPPEGANRAPGIAGVLLLKNGGREIDFLGAGNRERHPDGDADGNRGGPEEAAAAAAAAAVADFIRTTVFGLPGNRTHVKLERIDGAPAAVHPFAAHLVSAGMQSDGKNLFLWKY